jgi:anti-anti-sigma factor
MVRNGPLGVSFSTPGLAAAIPRRPFLFADSEWQCYNEKASQRRAAMKDRDSIQIGQVQGVNWIRLIGKGTYTHSACFHEIVEEFFQQHSRQVVVDLTRCSYLDSTFLGCLVRLCRQYHTPPGKRFVIVATEQKQVQLFASSQLQRFLIFDNAHAADTNSWDEVEIMWTDARTLGRHVMQCHRTIGELNIPDADKFARIAEHLAAELPPEA